LQEHHLAEGALRVGGIMEGIEHLGYPNCYFLQCNDLLEFAVYSLPNDPVGALA
jgi:hypothetical protein